MASFISSLEKPARLVMMFFANSTKPVFLGWHLKVINSKWQCVLMKPGLLHVKLVDL